MAERTEAECRRDELAEAAIRVVAQGGIDALTIRSVAAEAGVSTGGLAFYFPNKDELLKAAEQLAMDKMYLRVAELPGSSTPLEHLRESLLTTLPLDPDTEAETAVWLAFAARAVTREEFVELQSANRRRWLTKIEELVTVAQDAGELGTSRHTSHIAKELCTLIDGIAIGGILFGPDKLSFAEQRRILNTRLAELADG